MFEWHTQTPYPQSEEWLEIVASVASQSSSHPDNTYQKVSTASHTRHAVDAERIRPKDMDKHTHQFVVITEIDRTNMEKRVIPGVVVACPHCREVREIFRDGLMTTTNKGQFTN